MNIFQSIRFFDEIRNFEYIILIGQTFVKKFRIHFFHENRFKNFFGNEKIKQIKKPLQNDFHPIKIEFEKQKCVFQQMLIAITGP